MSSSDMDVEGAEGERHGPQELLTPATQADADATDDTQNTPAINQPTTGASPPKPKDPKQPPSAKKKKMASHHTSDEALLAIMEKDKDSAKVRTFITETKDIHVSTLDWVKKVGEKGQLRTLDQARLKQLTTSVTTNPPLHPVHCMVVEDGGVLRFTDIGEC
jgi:hypothetical protein